jgi:hypothetical protein
MYLPVTQYCVTVWEKLESAKAKTIEYKDVVRVEVNDNGDLLILRAQFSQFNSVGYAAEQWQKYEVLEDYGPIWPMHKGSAEGGPLRGGEKEEA